MRRLSLAGLFLLCGASALADAPKPLATGLKSPESVCLGTDGAAYITEIGEFGKDGDGQVSVLRDGKTTVFAKGLDDPKGIVMFQNILYVADKARVVKIDAEGKVSTFVAAESFPKKPLFLNDIALDPEGAKLFVSDSGDLMGKEGAVYSIDVKTGKTGLVIDAKTMPGLHTPNGLVMDGASHLLVLDFGTATLSRVKLVDGSSKRIAEGFDGGDGLTWDKFGRLFVTSWKTAQVFGINRPGLKPVVLPTKLESAADSCLDATGRFVLVPDMKAGTLNAIPAVVPGFEVDESPLPVGLETAFPKLKWTGWEPTNDEGQVTPLRPILLTHFGDGSNRVVVPTQQGVIHVFANDDSAEATKIYLDIRSKVRYADKQNEEGLLGLVFHPKYKENGEFFVFYTDVKKEMENVVSRFKVSKNDPTKADPESEEVLLRIERPFWNHDGGTLAFGPDGYLYIALGDGGSGGDPHENGQNLKTILGQVLRIDVDHKGDGKKYAIPKDNPFVGKKGAAPEIYAYGLRNIWRMAFDRKTGWLWAGEVGQNLYEEISIIKSGGNYGWNIRESLHPFGAKGVDVQPDLIDPIWEYHHDVGKSITGGLVYRGGKIPELEGAYLYADYVSAKVWALRYDEAKGRVVANHEIKGPGVPVLSFGEDEKGNAYLMTHTQSGKGIFRFVKSTGK
ncbi:MAG: PQQ-dependent sugar dehydrogenase [Planctomycetaceae bacterium]|nr:PQQ-dependent sugar dehydrogenase [Planctomycetaceae bacterium]